MNDQAHIEMGYNRYKLVAVAGDGEGSC